MRRQGTPRPDADDSDELAVLTTAQTPEQAGAAHAALQAAGIEARIVDVAKAAPGDELAARLGPGVHVLVQRADLPPARQVLHLPDADEPDDESDGDGHGEELAAGSAPDEYAAAAYRLAFFSCAFWPLLVLTLAFIVRAIRAGRLEPALNKTTYRRHLIQAFVMGVLIPAAIIVALVVVSSPVWHR